MTEQFDLTGARSHGRLLRSQKLYDEALSAFISALEFCGNDKPARSDIHDEIARLYLEQKKHELSINESKKAIDANCANPGAHMSLGMAYKERKQYAEALGEYDKALKHCKDNGEMESNIRNEMAQVLFEQKELDPSIAELKKALESNKDNTLSRLWLGMVYREKKQYGKALAELDTALKSCKDNRESESNIRCERALVYFEQGDYDQAVTELNKAFELNIESERAYSSLLAKIYKKQKNIDLCVETNGKYLKMWEDEDYARNRELELKLRALGNAGLPAGALKAKIIRTPYFAPAKKDILNYSLLLPIGMGQIVSYLRANGAQIDQDDLYIRLNHDNLFGKPEEKIDASVFWDEKRILAYSGGKDDPYIESVMERVGEKTSLEGYSVIMLSMPWEFENPSGHMFALAFAKFIKARYGPFIIAGGDDCKIDSFAKYDTSHIDLIGRGKGEKLLFAVLTALKYQLRVDKTLCLPVKFEGKIVSAAEASPFGTTPDYSDLPLHLYQYGNSRTVYGAGAEPGTTVNEFNNSRLMVAPFMLMEGCFYECIFCSCSDTADVSTLTPAKAVERLGDLSRRYGIKNFFFLNSLINISKKYVNEFCDEIINSKLDILWSDCARADNLDRDMLIKMRKAGCVRLIYGMETASPKLLEYIDKGISLRRLEDILRWTDEAGIMSGLEIICGFPGETQEDLRMTVDYIKKNSAYLNTVYCNTLSLYQGSKLYSFPEKYGLKNITENCSCGADTKTGYDEINGLRWEDRLKEANRAFGYIAENIRDKNFNVFSNEYEHLMFYLYSKFDDKNKVVKTFNEILRAYRDEGAPAALKPAGATPECAPQAGAH